MSGKDGDDGLASEKVRGFSDTRLDLAERHLDRGRPGPRSWRLATGDALQRAQIVPVVSSGTDILRRQLRCVADEVRQEKLQARVRLGDGGPFNDALGARYISVAVLDRHLGSDDAAVNVVQHGGRYFVASVRVFPSPDVVVWYLDANGQSDLAARRHDKALQSLAKRLLGFRARVGNLKDGLREDRSFLGRRGRPGAIGIAGLLPGRTWSSARSFARVMAESWSRRGRSRRYATKEKGMEEFEQLQRGLPWLPVRTQAAASRAMSIASETAVSVAMLWSI
ncbi:hypothetical protein CPLU01_13190 [Colletotrichum plurivorum]|uniref:Uncharacterized protein n=1 Tax=Colletotrichum plurivorum TaxID=2175906 RepID=A0A8H6JU66_9PEZI|nr:hypothetical protein CPLU01_13190 [Colletotrichum plurivorum]